MQTFKVKDSTNAAPLLAAVGPLQFEVVQYRLKTEYGAESRMEGAEWSYVRWVSPEVTEAMLDAAVMPSGAKQATDSDDQIAILFPSEWSIRYFTQQNPTIALTDTPARKAALVKP